MLSFSSLDATPHIQCHISLTIFLVKQRVSHGRDIAGWGTVVLTHHKCLNTGVSAAPWLAAGHLIKEESQMGVEKLDVLPWKIFATKLPPSLSTCVIMFNAYNNT